MLWLNHELLQCVCLVDGQLAEEMATRIYSVVLKNTALCVSAQARLLFFAIKVDNTSSESSPQKFQFASSPSSCFSTNSVPRSSDVRFIRAWNPLPNDIVHASTSASRTAALTFDVYSIGAHAYSYSFSVLLFAKLLQVFLFQTFEMHEEMDRWINKWINKRMNDLTNK